MRDAQHTSTTAVANIATPANKAKLTKDIKSQSAYIAEMESCLAMEQRTTPDATFFWHLGDRKSVFCLERERRELESMQAQRKALDVKPN